MSYLLTLDVNYSFGISLLQIFVYPLMNNEHPEDGEIRDVPFPFYKSHYKYSYYPNSSIFIGKNSLPNFMNYTSEQMCAKLKKELKSDYPLLNENILEASRNFFENKFLNITSDSSNIPEKSEREGKDIPAHNDLDTQLSISLNSASLNKDLNEHVNSGRVYDPEINFELISAEINHKDIDFSKPTKDGKLRANFFRDQFFDKKHDYENIYIFEDKTIEEIDNKHAYILLRVVVQTREQIGNSISSGYEPTIKFKYELVDSSTEDISCVDEQISSSPEMGRKSPSASGDNENISKTEKRSSKFTKYIFQDIFYNNIPFYDFVDLITEDALRSYNSSEIRKYITKSESLDKGYYSVYNNYRKGENLFIIFSGTTFLYAGKIRQIWNNLETGKNTKLIYNKNGIKPWEFIYPHQFDLKFISELRLAEGEYMINNRNVYRITEKGEKIPYKDINYDGFINAYSE